MSKTRSKIYIDQEFAFVLYKGELRIYHIQIGQDIKQEDYREIMEQVLPKRAKLRAMNLLKQREYTRWQLQKKLKEGYYPSRVIEEALDYVASFRYIDDNRYALDYITYHESSKSRRRIAQDLRNKGLSGETIEKAFLAWEDAGGNQNEGEMIRRLLEKKGFDPQLAEDKERVKMAGFLLRKGFSSDKVRRAVYGTDYT